MLLWKGATIQAKIEEMRDAIQGFSDDDVYAAIKTGESLPTQSKGLLSEIAVLLRDIRNNQMNQ